VSLTTSEIESLRAHLDYGNLTTGAQPYSVDGFNSLFTTVIAPNLGTATETSSTTLIAAGIVVVTPVDMTDIVAGCTLVVDVGEDAEVVQVKAAAASTFTARFAKAHAASGYPIALMCGKARLRFLLAQADRLWAKRQGSDITQTAGLKQLGQGEIEWMNGASGVIADVSSQYAQIVADIASLCRVAPSGAGADHGALEMY
jgi:hypothetical protein